MTNSSFQHFPYAVLALNVCFHHEKRWVAAGHVWKKVLKNSIGMNLQDIEKSGPIYSLYFLEMKGYSQGFYSRFSLCPEGR